MAQSNCEETLELLSLQWDKWTKETNEPNATQEQIDAAFDKYIEELGKLLNHPAPPYPRRRPL